VWLLTLIEYSELSLFLLTVGIHFRLSRIT